MSEIVKIKELIDPATDWHLPIYTMLFEYWQEGNFKKFSIAKKFLERRRVKSKVVRGRKKPVTKAVQLLKRDFDLSEANPEEFSQHSLPAFDVNNRAKSNCEHSLALIIFHGAEDVKCNRSTKEWQAKDLCEKLTVDDIKAMYDEEEFEMITECFNRILTSLDLPTIPFFKATIPNEIMGPEVTLLTGFPNVVEESEPEENAFGDWFDDDDD